MKLFVWNILDWIDNNINHRYLDKLTNIIPVEDENGNDTLFYIIWHSTSGRYCQWVCDLWFEWFGQEEMTK